ncbi:MAG TPA: ABC transporter ATP-binding protein [Candidatus Saccharimonadales bacterium]|jgi:ATP-binding cassette subfamily B protein|nr:ABC transporter ATP-binding protein [Candidatus Saccharimonadales bacterium]
MKLKNYYSLRSFLNYIGRYKLRLSIVFASFVVANLLLAIIPLFIGWLVGDLAAHPVNTHGVELAVIVLIACSVGHDIMWHVSEFLYLKLFMGIIYKYENIIFQQVIEKPYPYFVDKFTGKISSYITTLSQEFREQLEKFFWDYASHVVSLITVCVLLIVLNWQTGLVFVGSILLMLIIGTHTVSNSIKYEKVLTDVQSTKNGKIIDAIANFVNVKSFKKEDEEIKRIKVEQDKTIHTAKRSFLWSMFFWGSMGLIVRMVIWPATILLNVYLFLHHQISLAQLTAFLTAVTLFTTYVWDIIWSLSQFTLKLARVEEAYTYLFGPTNLSAEYFQKLDAPAKARSFDNSLVLSKLHFAYPDQPDTNALVAINLEIKKGEKIGIVGKSGSGKTTLTKLMLGYYPVEDGQILLDGQPIKTTELAKLISYVPQDTALFHRSIAENIAYASHKAVTRQDIEKAAKQAHAEEFIVQIPEKYDALVGERGVKLSAGQRQRIAIARAYLDDKPVLVLDEATSALDSESEIFVQQALEALWQHKTVLAIAHRLSTLRNMDRIVVLEKGRIVEEGSHADLLKQNGLYARLWAHQSGGFIEDEG